MCRPHAPQTRYCDFCCAAMPVAFVFSRQCIGATGGSEATSFLPTRFCSVISLPRARTVPGISEVRCVAHSPEFLYVCHYGAENADELGGPVGVSSYGETLLQAKRHHV